MFIEVYIVKIPIKQAKIWKHGKSNVITIPKELLKNGLLKEGFYYDFEVEVLN
jgi:antitoxin component of MazEF toxin-antitoxin module